MKNNVIKIISIIMLAVMIMTTISEMLNVQATSIDDVSAAYIRDNAIDTTGASEKIKTIIQAILVVTQVIGVGVAVIMLVVLAIKYISAAPSDKAEIKKHMVVYVVGAILLFAAAGILEIIKKFTDIINK